MIKNITGIINIIDQLDQNAMVIFNQITVGKCQIFQRLNMAIGNKFLV